MTSQLSAALRATAAGIHPDEARTGLIISHGAFLQRSDFTRHVETAACITDGTPMAWIDWDAVSAALDSGHLPLLRRGTAHRPRRGQPRRQATPSACATPSPASTSAACSGRHRHPPCRRAAVNISLAAADAMEPGQLLQFLDDWLATDHGKVTRP